MTWEDLKILLVRMDMTVTDLAREINCARPSVYLAFSERNRPGVMRKIRDFYAKHRRRPAKRRTARPSSPPSMPAHNRPRP